MDNVHKNITAQEREELIVALKDAFALRASNIKESIRLTEQLLERFVDLQENSLAAEAKNHLGLFYLIRGDFKIALEYSQQALNFFQSENNSQGIANAKYNIASVYYRTNNYHEALLLLAEALKIYQELSDRYNEARTYKSMGTIYEYFGDLERATRAYENSIAACRAINDQSLESNALNPLSAIYFKQGHPELAMETIERSIRLKNETGDTRGLAFALYGRGKLFIKLHQHEKAVKDLQETIRIMTDAGDRLGLGMAYNKLGVAYMELGNLSAARTNFEYALDVSRKFNVELIHFKVDYNLYLLCKKEGNFEEALRYFEKYMQHKESVINKDSYRAVSQLEILARESALQKEKNLIIESKNAELDSFFYRVSHDLKGPISSLQGLHQLVLIDIKDEAALTYFSMYHSQVMRLNNIVLGLINLTRLNHLEQKPVEINFNTLVNDCIDSFRHFENFKKTIFVKNIEPFKYSCDWTLINAVVQNLIENAIKYGNLQDPVVEISVKKLDDSIEIMVKDNGIGIAEEHQEKIFSMFYRATDKSKGSGLGLYILKRAVERLKGTIVLQSKLYEGSIFKIKLPAENH